MRILVFGASGQLGKSLIDIATMHNRELIGLEKKDCDVTDIFAVKREISYHKPDVVINAAAWTDVAGAEKNKFTLQDVIKGVCEKLINRHPHIYGDIKVADEVEVKRNWEKLKLKEGKKSILAGVPKSLPSMVKAMRLQEKAKQVGFEWENKEQVWEKVKEEENELFEAIKSNNNEHIEEELGDYFFSIVNFARFLQVDADNALELTNKKFISRVTKMEAEALKEGTDLNKMTLLEMDAIWNKIKKQ